MSIYKKEIISNFKNHEDKYLRLVAVLDINLLTFPYYYKTIFHDLNSESTYVIIDIEPEKLRNRYKVGRVYKNGLPVEWSTPKLKEFEINNSKNIYLKRISDILNPKNISFLPDKYKDSFLNQFCIYIKYDTYDLLIPSYTVVNRFYFVSSAMKEIIISGLYENFFISQTYKRDNEESIQLFNLEHINRRDVPYICRFSENKYSNNQFTYISNQRQYLNNLGLTQVKANLPVNKKFNINASYEKLQNDNQPLYIITDIYSDTLKFNFNNIKYNTYSRNKGTSKIILPNYSIDRVPISDNKHFSHINYPTTNLLLNTTIYKFNIFRIYYEVLIQQYGVIHAHISNTIPLKKNRKSAYGNISSKFLLHDRKTPRSYIYGHFYFDNKKIYFIEIERDQAWQSISTWFLISKKIDIDLAEYDFTEIITNYISEQLIYLKFSEYLLKNYSVIFKYQIHHNIHNDIQLENWSEEILEKILLL